MKQTYQEQYKRLNEKIAINELIGMGLTASAFFLYYYIGAEHHNLTGENDAIYSPEKTYNTVWQSLEYVSLLLTAGVSNIYGFNRLGQAIKDQVKLSELETKANIEKITEIFD